MEAARDILWPVVGQHLDEAEFLLEQWASPTLRAKLSLEKLQRSIEPRLEAHLDGLAVGGEEVAQRLLWPALRGEAGDAEAGGGGDATPERRLAAAAALAESGAPGAVRALLAFAAEAENERGPGAAAVDGALAIASRPAVDEAVRAALPGATPARLRGLLGVLAARRADPGGALASLLDTRDPDVLGAALRAGSAVRSEAARPLVAHLLRSNDRRLRATAIQVAVEWGMEVGWRACLDRARRGDPRVLPPLALFGGPAELALVIEALGDPRRRELALWALGFSGRAEAVDAVVPLLGGGERTARLAGEVISAITGLAVEGELRRAPAPEPDELPELAEDLATDLRPDPADGLPIPAAEPVAAWWQANRARFEPGARYLAGRPYAADAVYEALACGPLRRFEVLAFELAVRSEGRVLLPRPRLGLELPPAAALDGLDFQAPPRRS
jgi:uncharacterized protein (TIGR02270 family)